MTKPQYRTALIVGTVKMSIGAMTSRSQVPPTGYFHNRLRWYQKNTAFRDARSSKIDIKSLSYKTRTLESGSSSFPRRYGLLEYPLEQVGGWS